MSASHSGLTAVEVAQRRRAGKANTLPPRTGKTVADIVRSNVFTRINAILGVLFVMVMTTGSWINGAFGLLIVVNSAIGIVQELRARQTLESLSLIGEEHPTVLRYGVEQQVAQSELVLDDVVCLRSGNEIVVDGVLLESDDLAVDESMLTGESDAVLKHPGDEILSGSFVVVGTGKYQVTKVGAESYAAKIAAQAAKYTLSKSQLQQGIDAILKVIVWVLVPVGLLTIFTQYHHATGTWQSTILAITGALVPMVPEGLILITSTAFALGVIRLGKRKCLVNELPAIEGLARVDVVCADKTGTLTENTLNFAGLARLGDSVEIDSAGVAISRGTLAADDEFVSQVLAQLAWLDPDPNATVNALRAAFSQPESTWDVRARKPFSSVHKWSGMSFTDSSLSTMVIGAPDVVSTNPDWLTLADEIGEQGLRVLMLAQTSMLVDDVQTVDGRITIGLEPLALLVFVQKIRPDVAQTLEFFQAQGVEVKIISGDNARSVAAVSKQLGVSAGEPVDARSLTEQNFASQVNTGLVFGRVRPEQKREMVQALQAAGHNVAMTGDGVNDVLALKDADIGVAMGSGASASRAVAKIVLLDNKFATLPYVVAEGRRVIGNIERVANLFLTKTIYSALIAILVVLAAVPFPFLPIHVTITGWFTIGIPAFILSLPPNYQRAQQGFVRRVLGFALPAGLIVGASSFTTYLVVSAGHVPAQHVPQSTAALLALILPSTWVLAVVARPLNWWKAALVALSLAAYALIFTLPLTQRLFVLDSSNVQMMLTALAIGGVGAVFVEVLWRVQKHRQN